MRIHLKKKQILYILIDAISVNIAFFLAIYFRYGRRVLENIPQEWKQLSLLITAAFIISYLAFKYYVIIWIHAGLDELMYAIAANVIAGSFIAATQIIDRKIYLPQVLLGTMFAAAITIGLRLFYRAYILAKARIKSKCTNCEKVLVIGGGEAGVTAIKEMRNNEYTKLCPVCIVDDRKSLIGTYISGIPVAGGTKDLEKIVEKFKVELILLAIPSLGDKRKKEIISLAMATGCKLKTMPGIYELISGEDTLSQIRSIKPEDVLGRTKVHVDYDLLEGFYKGKTILITGAAGVMGSNIAKLAGRLIPQALILVDINENRLNEIQKNIIEKFPGVTVKCFLTSIKNIRGINSLFNKYKPEIVFHCAFHNNEKLMDMTASEVISNNIFGTLNVLNAAQNNKTQRVVILSTNKAYEPDNILNATKRICEMAGQSMAKHTGMNIVSVRFADVVNNAEFYAKRILDDISGGGPVWVEHKELTRFNFSQKHVTEQILVCGTSEEKGEVYVLDMGQPVRIYDLAKQLIAISKEKSNVGIEISVTGSIDENDIRVLMPQDINESNKSGFEGIYNTRTEFDNFLKLKEKLDDLKIIMDNGNEDLVSYKVFETIKDLIPTFHALTFEEAFPDGSDFDWQDEINAPRRKKIFLSAPHMGGIEQMYVKQAFDTNWLAPLGPNVDEFEKDVQEYVEINAASAMTSGTAAVHMALRMLGVKQDDYVFCSSLTFAGSCNPIIYEHAIPVFIDSEPYSWNMSPEALQKAFDECEREEKLPKAVIVVNLYGQSADFDRLKEIADKYNVPIIEDAAESLGATYKGKHTGTFGEYGVFSFNGNKIITTSGGGMLVSRNELAIKKVKFAITQARDPARHYQHSELGFNYRMSNVLAGIGRGQLKVLNLRVKRKKQIYEYYKDAFKGIPDIEMMPVADFGEPNYWLSVLTLKPESKVKPLDIMVALENEQIESRPVWKPMHLQPFYMKYPFYSHNDEGISVAEDLFDRGVCLPSDTQMTEFELGEVVRIVKGLWGQAG